VRRVLFFEDEKSQQLSPLALTRPVFELVCGRFSLRERVVRTYRPTLWGALVRNHLRDSYAEEFSNTLVNDFIWLQDAPTVVINGRWLPDPASLNKVTDDQVGVVDGTVAWFVLHPDEAHVLSDESWPDEFGRIVKGREQVDAGGRMIEYPWDLVNQNADQLRFDFRQYSRPTGFEQANAAVLGSQSNVSIADSAVIDPFVVLDARPGPISIDPGAHIQSFTRLEGPCHIGRESKLFRALIRGGTTIGPVCRVGGEIEESILHGLVNKYHEGFIGHSYVCPWVNLGAMTSNSDLKNDYSIVGVPLTGEVIDSGSTKVGCFIGDHAKTAIDSMFNTGSSIGVMAMVLPGGELLPKHIPSFSRIWHGQLADGWDLNRSLDAVRATMSRRNLELTSIQETMLRTLHSDTANERHAAIERRDAKMQVVEGYQT
jgi:UDP-N-acetylglucosamine diphosphorylase/glucosamine-1-phosphate N-acetyltransferase